MPVGTSPRVARMLVEYWSGSAWVSLADTDGTSRVLRIEIQDMLNAPRMATIQLFNPRTSSSNIFETGDFDTVLKNKMKIRITDQATKSILFLGKVDDIAPENNLRGYTITVTAYDSLIELQQNILKKDTLNDSARSQKPGVGKNAFISSDIAQLIDFGSYNQGAGDRSIEVVNTTDSDDAGAHRFQASLGKTSTKDKDFTKSGNNFLNAIKRLGELEAGIESTASGAITGDLKPYNFYVDTNFKTTATNTEGTDNFFNYFPAGCMPAAAQSGTSYTVSNPADDGLTLVFGTGDTIAETGQTLKMLPSFSFEDIARERTTHLNAHFVNPVSGFAEDIEFEVFNYKSITNGTTIQDLYEPSGTGTGGTETSKTITQGQGGVFDAASGGNNIGFLQYLSNTGGAGFALLSGTTGDAGSVRHSVAAGEQLHVRNAGGTTVGTITLSDTTDANGSDIFRPQEVFKQKVLRNFSIETGDIIMIRRAIASAFANKDTRRVRANFSMASGYPYHFVEGQVNSVSTNTITDSTIANQHSTTTDGLASANIDSFPTAGVRTGMVLHKLSGEDGIMEEYGYISKTEDNNLTATLTNSATFSTNDYYRTYIPLRAGHSVQIKNLAINSSPFSHVVTDIKYTEGEKGFMTEINTVGDVSNPKASTAGPRIKPATPPIVYDDETYNEGVPLGLQLANFSGTFSAGNTSGGNKNTSISYSAGTLEVNGETFDISAGDSEDATTGLNGAMADSTNNVISFNPDVSSTKFIIETETNFKNNAAVAGGGSGNDASFSQHKEVIKVGTTKKASHSAAEASFELTHMELPGNNFKFDKDSISAKAITADQIKANTITAAEIAANTITAGQIEAGTITATELDSGAVTIGGSSATSGARFLLTHPNANPSGAGTDFFRAYDSNSTTNARGYWFNLDSHNQSIQITDGDNDASGPTVLVTIDKTGIEFTGGTLGSDSSGTRTITSTAATFTDGSNDRLRIGVSTTSGHNAKIFMPQSADTLTIGGNGAASVVPHNVLNKLGAPLMAWDEIYFDDLFSTTSGSVSLPNFSFNDDKDTGMYRESLNAVGITGNGGSGTVFANNSDSSNVFRNNIFPENSTQNGSAATTSFHYIGARHTSFSDGSGSFESRDYQGIVTQQLFIRAGSASTPSIVFNDGNSDTGLFFDTDEVGIAANDTEIATFTNSSGIKYTTRGTGSASAGNAIYVNSSTDALYEVTSSAKYKKDIVDLTIDTNKIYNLQPRNFAWKNTNDEDFGLIAEEVQEILPELVTYKDGEPNGVNYSGISVLLLKELKKLKQEIQELKENK